MKKELELNFEQKELARQEYVLKKLKENKLDYLPEEYKTKKEEAITFHEKELAFWKERVSSTKQEQSLFSKKSALGGLP
jgi:hypothetical protein